MNMDKIINSVVKNVKDNKNYVFTKNGDIVEDGFIIPLHKKEEIELTEDNILTMIKKYYEYLEEGLFFKF